MPHLFIFLFFLIFCSASLAEVKCPAGQVNVRAYYRKAYVRSDGVVVSATNIRAHCRLPSIVSKMWESRLINKPPADWPHKIEKFKDWTTSEKERLYEAMEALPEELVLANIDGIYRSQKSKDFPNPATSADKVIVFYDSAFESKNNFARILAHELAHQIYRDLPTKEKKDYGYSTNWIPIDPEGRQYVSRSKGFVQDDGRVSPEEDFANNVEFHLFESGELEKKTPQASRWIKNRYRDSFKFRERVKK